MTYQTDAQCDAASTDAEEAALVPEPTPEERDAVRRMLDADASEQAAAEARERKWEDVRVEDAYRTSVADWEREALEFAGEDIHPRPEGG